MPKSALKVIAFYSTSYFDKLLLNDNEFDNIINFVSSELELDKKGI